MNPLDAARFDNMLEEMATISKGGHLPAREGGVQSAVDAIEAVQAHGWVVFSISSEYLDPDQISRELGLQPDKVLHGDPENGYRGQWQLHSALAGHESMEAHFWNIMSRLVPVHRHLLKYSREYRLEFSCSIQKSQAVMEPIYLSSRLLLMIGYMGAEIELEVVEWTEDETSDSEPKDDSE